MTTDDLGTLADGALAALLEQLEADERRISARRRKLHELIGYRKTMGGADGMPATPEDLADLDRDERELSRARRDLHGRIGEVREERRRRSGG